MMMSGLCEHWAISLPLAFADEPHKGQVRGGGCLINALLDLHSQWSAWKKKGGRAGQGVSITEEKDTCFLLRWKGGEYYYFILWHTLRAAVHHQGRLEATVSHYHKWQDGLVLAGHATAAEEKMWWRVNTDLTFHARKQLSASKLMKPVCFL